MHADSARAKYTALTRPSAPLQRSYTIAIFRSSRESSLSYASAIHNSYARIPVAARSCSAPQSEPRPTFEGPTYDLW